MKRININQGGIIQKAGASEWQAVIRAGLNARTVQMVVSVEGCETQVVTIRIKGMVRVQEPNSV